MQDIIDRILEGNFDYENGSLDFSCTKVEISIPAGSVYEGTFRIRSTSGVLTDGYVITTDLRMECITPGFSGGDEEIAFCFHGENMEEGDVVKGAFNVISNHGEYYLPFVVSIEHTILHSSIGTIKNLFHFANLAKSNWQEAVNLFYSPSFACVFTGSDAKVYDCYRGLSVNPGNEQNVEEFLIQINKKQRVEYLVEEKEVVLEPGTAEGTYRMLEQEIEIVRNGWGYTALNIECDGDFLFTEKEFISDDDFLGNRCRLPIFIDTNLCRNGRNFGQVVLYNSYVCLTVPVTVKMGENGRADRTRKRIIVQLMKIYQAFRMKKISSGTWLKESGKLIDKLVVMDENDVPTRLFQSQLLISEERYNEAEWLLDHAMSLMEQRQMDDGDLLAYYLYLTTLIHRDEEYVDQIAMEVQQIYRRDTSQWRVAWLLLYLSEEYGKSFSAQWGFLEKQFYRGCSSPVIYIEALHLLGNNPALLRKLDSYELQVLYYGAKHQMLGIELVEQILYLAGKTREYSAVLLNILRFLYEKKKDTRILQEICTLLIKGGRSDYKSFEWYQKGVEAQLRITNLYEYYMLALDLSEPQELPKILLMYFSYQNNLDYEHSAYLYQYILQHQEEFPEIYESYRMRMERFVIDQIRKMHINRHLAFLYQNMLTPGMITEETAEALSRLLFAHQVQVEDNRLCKVIVYQSGCVNPREYVLQDGGTWIALYGNDYTILFEDRWGNRFVKNVEYTLEKLMMPGKFLRMIAHYNQNCPELDKYLCENDSYEVTADNIERALRVVVSENVTVAIKRELYLRILQYYYDADDMVSLDTCLENVPVTELRMEERGKVVKFMVLRGKYHIAYQWLMQYGPYFVDAKTLMRLTSEMIRRGNMMENKALTTAVAYAFQKGKYNSTILSYLNLYYCGMTKDMRDVWKAAHSFGVECYEIAERMIVQMLYSGAFVVEKMDILRYYVSQGAKGEVERALLIQCSYDYFVNQKLTDHYVFQEIRYAYLRGEEIHQVCKLAFLRYYAEYPGDLSKEDRPLIEDFMGELLRKNIHLNFFRELKDFGYLTRVMDDRTIVEYHARPGGKVRIHYVIINEHGEADEYLSEYMTPVYGGVCFKDFVLFFGENLQYYITEEFDGEEQLTESGTIQKSDIAAQNHSNRYEMINDINISKTLQDYNTLDKLLEELYRKEYWNKELFRLQ
uniref:DUF5717 family protein n=1 Tax=Acetatifactor sp. TaxID=1872090 RepID=UPI004055D5C7